MVQKIIWTHRVRNEEVLHGIVKKRNVLRTVKRRTANWIGYVMRGNCLLTDVSEGKIKGRIKVTGRRGRRRTELLDCLKEIKGYWKLKEEAVDRTVWRTGFGKGGGPVTCGVVVMMIMIVAVTSELLLRLGVSDDFRSMLYFYYFLYPYYPHPTPTAVQKR
jgi:hypothetical protein